MQTGFVQIGNREITQVVAELLLPRLLEAIATRAPGHCMRVFDLDQALIEQLAEDLRQSAPGAAIHILSDDPNAVGDLYVSSTKLVELRNPLPDGSLRPPLCVFVPPGTKASAEDSFGVATFEDFAVGSIYQDLKQQLILKVPGENQSRIRELLDYLSSVDWPWGGPLNQIRYLVAVSQNGFGDESLGAFLPELGLVPDFRLAESASTILPKFKKNLDCVRLITSADRTIRTAVLDLDLEDLSFKQKLAEYLLSFGTENPIVWTRAVLSDQKNWELSFDKWRFRSRTDQDKIVISAVSTDLPIVTAEQGEERLVDLIGQQVLSPKERKRMTVSIVLESAPSQVSTLDHLTLQIISRDGGPVGPTKKVKVANSKRTTFNAVFSRLDKIDFDEGWHFVRVLAWSADSDPIAIEAQGSGLPPANQSEPFYVMPGVGIDEEPPQRAVPRAVSVEHGKIEKQFTAILQRREPADIKVDSVSWGQQSAGKRIASQEVLEAKFGAEGSLQVPVPRWLKVVEQRLLSIPERPSSWHMQISLGQPSHPAADACDLPNSNSNRAFIDARVAYFTEVRRAPKELVSQAADFLTLQMLALNYASAYRELIQDLSARLERSTGTDQQKALLSLRTALAIDTIRLVTTDYRGHIREAALVAPTHPLRALWHVCWAQLASNWVESSRNAPEESLPAARAALVKILSPLNFPAVASLGDGRLFASVDNIHPFWSLYAPAMEEDARGLLAEICSALEVPEPSIGGSTLTPHVLAARIERYLLQHPYIRVLSVNAFNPGSAALLAETLLILQEQDAFSDLRYDIRLFAPDAEQPGLGDALNLLLSPESSSATDVFSIPSKSHIFSKLSIAMRSSTEFRTAPGLYRAHLTLLFDVFPPQEIGAAPPLGTQPFVPLSGLVQEFVTRFRDDETGTSWVRQPRFGQPAPNDESEAGQLLCELSKIFAAASVAVAQGGAAAESYPTITLELNSEQRSLIHAVHETSDWVFTVDRNMGIEFFDHAGKKDRPDYLIDYVPSTTPGLGHRLIISSRSISELESMLRPVLEQYGIGGKSIDALAILDQLRSLSGRIALKLVSSSTSKAEVLGLALARLFLQSNGALRNQIVIPLDSHIELFQQAKAGFEELGDDVTVKRTDLALFDLDLGQRTINCNLVEVKCYSQKLGFSGYAQLKENITTQIGQSERVLQHHFDPERTTPDRPDRALKTRELSILLRFYLERAIRHGLFDDDATIEAQCFVDSLDAGYELRFTRTGLVFDFEKTGTDPVENEVGVEFHRIGIDVIRRLVAQGHSETDSTSDDGSGGAAGPGQTESSKAILPRPASAAFFPRERTRKLSAELSAETVPPTRGDEADQSEDGQMNSRGLGKSEPDAHAENIDESRFVQPSEPEQQQKAPEESSLHYDVLIGATDESPQYGILGESGSRRIALDLNQTHTISLFGVQGGGKSYTLGTIIEMACMQAKGLSMLPRPLAAILFHYSSTLDYKPEFTSMIHPNSNPSQVRVLHDKFGALPQALSNIVVLVPSSKVKERAREYPGLQVLPIAFAARELKASHWKFLMGAVGSQSLYLRQVNLIMKRLRDDLTLPSIVAAVNDSGLSDHLKELALLRLKFAGEYINDSIAMTGIVRPGRLVIVDLRDEFIEKDEALGLFVVLLQLFAEATYADKPFNRLVVFDEAHKYMESADLISGLVEVVREMRHKGTSILVASQDPPSVPTALIELSSQILLHKFNSPAWLKHIQKANSALNGLTPERLSALGAGEAFLWSSKATDPSFSYGAVKIRCRPRLTQHGGATKTAL